MIDYEGTRSLLQDSPTPLNVVLLQEIQRYNLLLETIMYELHISCDSGTLRAAKHARV